MLCAAALIGAIGLVYANSLAVPFVFDDYSAIVTNPTLRHLWPLGPVLAPPHAAGETVGGRPLLNVSFAINYAIGGLGVRGYHVGNILFHCATTLLLCGLIRRTWPKTAAPNAARSGTVVALAIAAVWALHPLATESITYVSQRAESFAAFWCVLTLYAFVRGTEREAVPVASAAALRWYLVAIVACGGGIASKEIGVSAPLIVWLYDRTFVAGSFATAWRRRWRIYVALGATWILAGWLLLINGDRGGTVGFSTAGVTPWTYALTQSEAIVRYLGLALWPQSLVFDYGTTTVQHLRDVAPQVVVIVLLAGAAGIAWSRAPQIAFLGAVFFLVLAPSSSFVPIVSQTIAEHRMYLPLAVCVIAAVAMAASFAGSRGLLAVAVGAIALGALTAHRNQTYRSAFTLWSDTVAKRSNNPRAHNNLAVLLIERGRYQSAADQEFAALRLDPDFAEAHNNLATALSALGRRTDAIAHLREAVRLRPDYAEAYNNLGRELMADRSTLPDAIVALRRATALHVGYADAEDNLGLALVRAGRPRDSLPHLSTAVRLAPASYQAHNNLGIALASCGRAADSLAEFQRAAEINPAMPSIHDNWGKALVLLGRTIDADRQFRIATQLRAGAATASRP